MDDARLISRIVESSLLRGTFTLRSGRTSSYYLDKYRFETQPDILAELARRLAGFADPQTTRIAGAELGGVPLATAVSLRTELPAVLVRNRKKGYGASNLCEGLVEAGDRVLLVEDVVTSGGQILEAADSLKETGATVQRIVAVIDREEGARATIEAEGFAFESLLTKTALGISE
jgi:orotate phosphoribosyltransferase